MGLYALQDQNSKVLHYGNYLSKGESTIDEVAKVILCSLASLHCKCAIGHYMLTVYLANRKC